MSSFRYIVGIDLGTSSCSLSYVDRYAAEAEPRTMSLTQCHSQGLVESQTLPSFCFLPKTKEAEKYKIPFSSFSDPYVVGALAQERLASHPDLVVHSAKSWLCHGGIDREAKILPWHSDTLIGDKRLSPVYVSSLYLRHIKDVWNHTIAAGREDFLLEKQKIVITVPASFDETASFLTLEASKLAGLGGDVTLCEEPQAAFYYWLSKRKVQELEANSHILVIDIGGGTTDFCLFKTFFDHNSKDLKIERVAVSEHILLGGDNIDLALAHIAERKMQGTDKLRGEKWTQLVFECRRLKELILSNCSSKAEDVYRLTLQTASGSKLFGQTLTLEFSHQEIIDTINEGFFPFCSRNERPQRRTLGLKEWGLPYAEDSAVTKHLAEFLDGKNVDQVLYTGGSLVPEFLRKRLSEQIAQWQGKEVRVLENDALELAVSRGASVYGFKKVRQDAQVSSGYPRSLYVKVMHSETQVPHYLCVLPKGFLGMETLKVSLSGLHALVGQLASFELFSSLHRQDAAGVLIEEDSQLKAVSVLQTRLGDAPNKKGERVPISLETRLAGSGLLELSCVSPSLQASYPLKFSLYTKAESKNAPAVSNDTSPLRRANALISRFYGKEKVPVKLNPMSLPVDLESIFGRSRKDWDLSTLRQLWPALKDGMNRRNRSEQHEMAWLNLSGYVLRPGYGEQQDTQRIREIQRSFEQGPAFPGSAKVKNQWWIFWRRIAGGLDRNTQEFIFSKVYPLIKREDCTPEMFLLLGALERVDMQKRVSLGQWLSSDLVSSSMHREQKIWALTRIANRLPLYAGAECIVRPNFVLPWLEKLSVLDLKKTTGLAGFYANACRLIDDRELDIPEEWRVKVIRALEASGHSSQLEMVKKYIPQDSQTVSLLLGESLPIGLTIS